jgi:hypothetical protein
LKGTFFNLAEAPKLKRAELAVELTARVALTHSDAGCLDGLGGDTAFQLILCGIIRCFEATA